MMLFIASLSFANTISNEMDIEATELETKEVSLDSNSTNSLVVENEEDWRYCYIREWHVVIATFEDYFTGGIIEFYVDLSYEVCYDL